jgi:hypothetical protein
MRVADFFAPRSATPDTRAEAEASLRSTVGNDVTSETPTTEIVSGDGNAILHDTVVHDDSTALVTTGEGVPGFSGDSVPETTKACGCPEGECRGATPETVEAAMKVAEEKAKAEGVSPGEPRFGEIIQTTMNETFGEGIVTVSGPFTDEQPTDANTLAFGFDDDGLVGRNDDNLDEDEFFKALTELFGKAPPENTTSGSMPMPEGLLEAIFASGPPPSELEFLHAQRPLDPFPFFTSLGRDEPDFSRISNQTQARIEQDRRDEEDDEAFDQEGREVIQSLTATMEQLVQLATKIYG